jgi:hypothetical protein
MNIKHFILSPLMIFCSTSWADQIQIKVSGAEANAILAAYRYTLTNFPDNGAPVKNVRCNSTGCEYEYNSEESSSTGTMIGAREMANLVLRCADGIASELRCQSSAKFVVSCIATCQNN